MNRTLFETVIGALVLLVAFGFLIFAMDNSQVGRVSGYEVRAKFSKVDGVAVGGDVKISGIKVGTIRNIQLDPKKYNAEISMEINQDVKLPKDTFARIDSEGLLGGRYLTLVPGADDKFMKNGDLVAYTQPPVDLVDLLGRFVFSSGSSSNNSAPNTQKTTP